MEYMEKGRLDDEMGKAYYKGRNEDKLKYDNQQLGLLKATKTPEISLPLNKHETLSKLCTIAHTVIQ